MKITIIAFCIGFAVFNTAYITAQDESGLFKRTKDLSNAEIEQADKLNSPQTGILLAGDCSDYIDLSGLPLPIAVSGNLNNATNNYGPFANLPPDCWQGLWVEACAGGRDATYKWMAPNSDYYIFEVCNANYDADILLYNFTCPDEPVYPDDFICGTDWGFCPAQGPLTYQGGLQCIFLEEGQEVLIVVDAYYGNYGAYELAIYQGEPPPPPFECYGNSICNQPAAIPIDKYISQTSDLYSSYKVYDNFPGVTGTVCELGFWGFDEYYSGGWYPCEEDPMSFRITYYDDIGGLPGNQIYYENVTPSRVATGLEYNGWELNYYEVTFDSCFDVDNGWISIQGTSTNGDPQNCLFIWMSSLEGDDKSYQWDGNTFNRRYFSMSMCFGLFVDIDDEYDQNRLPTTFSLKRNTPNPFNASTTIEYQLPQPSQVKIEIYDILGQRIAVFQDGIQQAGYHQVVWDAGDYSSGIYFYKLQAGNYNETRKMLLIK